jgi:methanol metabolism-related c-type cytochrome
VQRILRIAIIMSAALILPPSVVYAVTDGPADSAAVKSDDGKWVDKDGNPTFKVEKDGTIDWYTYIGFTRYSAECLRCHGPDGMGSTYAPALIDSLKNLSYMDFYGIVASGKNNVSSSQNLVMPAEGNNKNVMCFIEEIYTYLARPSMLSSRLGLKRPKTSAWDKSGYGLDTQARPQASRLASGRGAWAVARAPRRGAGPWPWGVRGTGRS